MKFNIFTLIIALSTLSLTTAWAEDQPYLYEQLKKPVYKKNFDVLFKGQSNLAPWLKAYLKNRDAVDTPREIRSIDGKQYEFYSLCEPHNCPDNNLFVLFEANGGQAWALFTKDDGSSRFFGNPNANIQEALKAEIHK